MNIEKLNLANLVGKVMDKIMEYQMYMYQVYIKMKTRNFKKFTKPLLHRKSGNLS